MGIWSRLRPDLRGAGLLVGCSCFDVGGRPRMDDLDC